MLDLKPLEGILESVYPGPWHDEVTSDGGLVVYMGDIAPADNPYSGQWLFFGDMEDTVWADHASAAFVAHSRTFVPMMIEEIKTLRKVVENLQGTILDLTEEIKKA